MLHCLSSRIQMYLGLKDNQNEELLQHVNFPATLALATMYDYSGEIRLSEPKTLLLPNSLKA